MSSATLTAYSKPEHIVPSEVLSFGKRPIYSITTNDNMICAGTKEDILWWDINKLDKPIGNFTECHSDNVTGMSFNSTGKYLISCSVDNVMSMFDLN